MTALTSTSAVTATPPALRSSGADFLTATGQTARRTMLQFLRTPQLLFMPPILGALFLFIFRYIFGGAISTGTDVEYVDFLVSGFLVQTVLWTAMNIPAGVAEDASSGVYDRLRSLPIPRAAVMAGRSLPTPRSMPGPSPSRPSSASRWVSAEVRQLEELGVAATGVPRPQPGLLDPTTRPARCQPRRR